MCVFSCVCVCACVCLVACVFDCAGAKGKATGKRGEKEKAVDMLYMCVWGLLEAAASSFLPLLCLPVFLNTTRSKPRKRSLITVALNSESTAKRNQTGEGLRMNGAC